MCFGRLTVAVDIPEGDLAVRCECLELGISLHHKAAFAVGNGHFNGLIDTLGEDTPARTGSQAYPATFEAT